MVFGGRWIPAFAGMTVGGGDGGGEDGVTAEWVRADLAGDGGVAFGEAGFLLSLE